MWLSGAAGRPTASRKPRRSAQSAPIAIPLSIVVGVEQLALVVVGVGAAATAETAAVAALAPERLRGSAFGLLAALQALGNLTASVIAGILWTAISPAAAFIYVAAWMALAVIGLAIAGRSTQPTDPPR